MDKEARILSVLHDPTTIDMSDLEKCVLLNASLYSIRIVYAKFETCFTCQYQLRRTKPLLHQITRF